VNDVLLLGMGEPAGDTFDRLYAYAERLPGRVHYLCLTRAWSAMRREDRDGKLFLYPTRSRTPLHALRDADRLAREIAERWRPAVTYAQDPFLTAWVGLRLRARAGVPLVIGNHSNFLDNPRWIAERPLVFRVLNQGARWVLPRADAWRVLNRDERDKYVRLGIPAERITVLNTPCRAAEFANWRDTGQIAALRDRLGIAADDELLVWVGRPVKVKRLPVLFDALRRLRERRPRARLLLVGDPARAQEDLAAAQEACGVAGRVVWAGEVPHAELPAYYRLARVYVHASHYEGFGKVMVEAAASGLPVVSTDTPGAREIVEEGVTGYRVPVDDAGALAARVAELLQDAGTAARMGAAGRRRALDEFDRERGIDAFLDMLRCAANHDTRNR
jgi:glycosyltransferase involved in cell wall biosynthesis